jgi:hypothetical protein
MTAITASRALAVLRHIGEQLERAAREVTQRVAGMPIGSNSSAYNAASSCLPYT